MTIRSRRKPQSDAAGLPLSQGFPPLGARHARVLVLGSLPGQASLAAGQYYAQPQNAFWRIMGALLDAGPALPYAERVARLERASVAVWDVLAAGQRAGSLDSAIVRSTAVVNDFQSLFRRHAAISLVCFNGRTAEHLYLRRVHADLPARAQAIPLHRLPSTSPAHAGMPFAAKLERWSILLEHLRASSRDHRAVT